METYPIADHPNAYFAHEPGWVTSQIVDEDGNPYPVNNRGQVTLTHESGERHTRQLRAWAYQAEIPRDGFPVPGFAGYTLDEHPSGWIVRSWRYSTRCPDRWPGSVLAVVPHYIDGRPMFNLRDDNNCNRRLQLGVIVLTAHGQMPDEPTGRVYCCHNNGDPFDNDLTNLRWDTAEANAADREMHRQSRLGYDPEVEY